MVIGYSKFSHSLINFEKIVYYRFSADDMMIGSKENQEICVNTYPRIQEPKEPKKLGFNLFLRELVGFHGKLLINKRSTVIPFNSLGQWSSRNQSCTNRHATSNYYSRKINIIIVIIFINEPNCVIKSINKNFHLFKRYRDCVPLIVYNSQHFWWYYIYWYRGLIWNRS